MAAVPACLGTLAQGVKRTFILFRSGLTVTVRMLGNVSRRGRQLQARKYSCQPAGLDHAIAHGAIVSIIVVDRSGNQATSDALIGEISLMKCGSLRCILYCAC